MAKRDRRGATSRQQRIAQTLAAQRRAEQRRRRLILMGTALALIAVVSAVTLAVVHQGGKAAAASSSELGPEGIALPAGPSLAPVSSAATGATVDGIQCDASEQVGYHIHAHLAVYVNGGSRQIPYGIGVATPAVNQTPQGPFAQATRCYYWLHTHASDGVIHVESPTQRQYTLGDFFDIWRQPLSATAVGPATGTVTASVNGVARSGDPRSIILSEHEDIQLDVGAPIVPPQPVDWSKSDL